MEVIASLALVSIVLIGIMSVINLVFKADENTTNQVNLTNEANLILSYIENEFYKNKNTNPTFIHEDGILKLCSEGNWKALHDEDITVADLYINGENPLNKPNIDCNNEKSSNKELSIKITIGLKNKPEEEITVETSFKRY